MSEMKHGPWTVTIDPQHIAWLLLDCDGSVNTLSASVLEALADMLDTLELVPHKALVFCSAKKNGFIAGADVQQLTSFPAWAALKAFLERAWSIISRVKSWSHPTVAMIDGFCLGGGLELAMACRYRVAVADGKTRLGLPEVKLGIVPAWGGMIFLPALVGLQAALDMILTGRTVDARTAKKMGLVDCSVPRRVVHHTVCFLLTTLPPARPLPWMLAIMTHSPLKGILFSFAKKSLAKKVNPAHYPAPYVVLEHCQRFGGRSLDIEDEDPASLFHLISHPTSKGLMRVFELQTRLKSMGRAAESGVCRVHIVGAGTMGADVAAWCLHQELTVTLQDVSAAKIAVAVGRIVQWLKKKARDPLVVQRALDRLIPDVEGRGLACADILIEAVVEDVAVKQNLFHCIEKVVPAHCILATNTSSLLIEHIAQAMDAPERLVGLHFFNPVTQMPLVEVVRGQQTDPVLFEQAITFVRRIDKLPLPVASVPGFLVNRILMAYLNQALQMVDAGFEPAQLDAAARAFGMMMGPVELADTVGLDVCLAVGKELSRDNSPSPASVLRLVANGKLGRKSGEGFYVYKRGKPVKARTAWPLQQDIIDRLMKPMYEMSRCCVEEGVVADGDLVDAGLIFGAGFAPFRGGPLFDIQHRQKAK